VKDIQILKKMCAEYMDFEVILHAFGRGLDFQDLIDWISEVDWYDQYLIDTIKQIKGRFPYVEISFDRELGIANLEVGNYEEAVEIFSRMLLEDEDQFDVLVWLGRSFANGGAPNIGRILLNEVLRRSKPASEEFKEALAALDEIIAADDLINPRNGEMIS
jgi:tetratricopeptide (TPR) repeat protein